MCSNAIDDLDPDNRESVVRFLWKSLLFGHRYGYRPIEDGNTLVNPETGVPDPPKGARSGVFYPRKEIVVSVIKEDEL
jgi:hypothetical protein